MALKKSELYSSLWQSCDALRGGMDASQYKDYVLVLLATVDMAMVDLAAARQSVDVAGVRRVIAAHPEWLPKLSRAVFSDDGIRRAMAECAALLPA